MPESRTKTKRKAPPHAFKPGQSGNPGGRPKKDPEVAEILKAAVPQAAQRLVELTQSDNERVALSACSEILDRALGKAETMSRVELTGADGGPVGIGVDLSGWSDADLNALWALQKKYDQ